MNPLIIVTIIYAIGYVVSTTFHFVTDRYMSKRLDSWHIDDTPVVIIGNVFWPILLPYLVYSVTTDFPDAKRADLEQARRKSIEAKRARRKEMIKTINNDIDRDEPRRREEILAGTPIVDVRPENKRKRCYICNEVRTPYATMYGDNGVLINTLSGVPAHEECLMGDLEDV